MAFWLFQLWMAGLDGLWIRFVRREPHWRRRGIGLLAFAAMGLVGSALVLPLAKTVVPFFYLAQLAAWGLVLHGSLCALGTAWFDRARPGRAVWEGLVALGILAIAGYANRIEPYRLEVTHTEIRTAKLTRPLRIGVVADLQTDHPGAFERRVLERLAAEQPDLILFCGDYIQQQDPELYRQEIEALNRLLRDVVLDPPMGAFAVGGDVDHTPAEWTRAFEGTGVICVLESKDFELGELRLTAASYADGFDTRLALEPPADGRFWLLFAHRPEMAVSNTPADLFVAGHTHGGQVQLPGFGPLTVLADIPRHWGAGGLTALDAQRQLYISRGIGMERDAAPRLRLFCRPELAILELIPTEPTAPLRQPG